MDISLPVFIVLSIAVLILWRNQPALSILYMPSFRFGDDPPLLICGSVHLRRPFSILSLSWFHVFSAFISSTHPPRFTNILDFSLSLFTPFVAC